MARLPTPNTRPGLGCRWGTLPPASAGHPGLQGVLAVGPKRTALPGWPDYLPLPEPSHSEPFAGYFSSPPPLSSILPAPIRQRPAFCQHTLLPWLARPPFYHQYSMPGLWAKGLCIANPISPRSVVSAGPIQQYGRSSGISRAASPKYHQYSMPGLWATGLCKANPTSPWSVVSA